METKPVVKDSLSALLTNGGDSAATKKAITLCLTKLLHKAVDLFLVFSHRKTQQQ
jgi:hypothetical protein